VTDAPSDVGSDRPPHAAPVWRHPGSNPLTR